MLRCGGCVASSLLQSVCGPLHSSWPKRRPRKRKYGGLRTDQAKRLKDLEKENARLKRRQAVEHVRDVLDRDVVTERRACRVRGQARNPQRRKACVADDESQLVKRIVWMASEYGRYGYRRITALLRAEGWWVNHKLVREWLERVGVKTLSSEPGSP